MLRIGSRGSKLALWQANHVAARLRGHGHEVSITVIHTTGDKITDVALSKVGGKGIFTKEIEEALAAGEIDLAVHSLKDLPTELPEAFELAAVGEREDVRDAFLSVKYASLAELPQGAVVGTSSLRRQAQLLKMRPDLQIVSLRGNVDTRLRKLREGACDAILLAAAGVSRLEMTELVRERLPVELLCPAAGQGALGIEIRRGDEATRAALAFFDHRPTRRAVECERALLAALGGGCQVPIGAHATVNGEEIRLRAICATPDGSRVLREECCGAEPLAVGRAAAEALLRRGAGEILQQVYGEAAPNQP
jgi:hydroxymethylbilane synthase